MECETGQGRTNPQLDAFMFNPPPPGPDKGVGDKSHQSSQAQSTAQVIARPRLMTPTRLWITFKLSSFALLMFGIATALASIPINSQSSRFTGKELTFHDFEAAAFPFVGGVICIVAISSSFADGDGKLQQSKSNQMFLLWQKSKSAVRRKSGSREQDKASVAAYEQRVRGGARDYGVILERDL